MNREDGVGAVKVVVSSFYRSNVMPTIRPMNAAEQSPSFEEECPEYSRNFTEH